MKICGGRGESAGIALAVFNLGIRLMWVVSFVALLLYPPRKQPPGTLWIGNLVAVKLVWMLWKGEKSLIPVQNQISNPWSSSQYPGHYTSWAVSWPQLSNNMSAYHSVSEIIFPYDLWLMNTNSHSDRTNLSRYSSTSGNSGFILRHCDNAESCTGSSRET
jgi:hypothetical protein